MGQTHSSNATFDGSTITTAMSSSIGRVFGIGKRDGGRSILLGACSCLEEQDYHEQEDMLDWVIVDGKDGAKVVHAITPNKANYSGPIINNKIHLSSRREDYCNEIRNGKNTISTNEVAKIQTVQSLMGAAIPSCVSTLVTDDVDDGDFVVIIVHGELSKKRHYFRLDRNSPMSQVFTYLATKIEKSVGIFFEFRNKPVSSLDTPNSLGMKHLDVIVMAFDSTKMENDSILGISGNNTSIVSF